MKILEQAKLKFETNPNLKADFIDAAIKLGKEDSNMRITLFEYISTHDDMVEEQIIDDILTRLQTLKLY